MSLIGIILIVICILVVIILIRGVISIVDGAIGAAKGRSYMRGEPIHFNYGGRRVTAYVRKIKKQGDKTFHLVVDKH
jgi:hypothetical protein